MALYNQLNPATNLPDGRIVVVGWADMGTGKVKGLPVSNFDIAVARYLPSGVLDTSFGNGTGKVTTNISTYNTADYNNERDGAYAVVVQDDGKIVVGGYSLTAQGTAEGVLVRYNTDGTLDTTFNASGPMPGVVQINLPNFYDDEVFDVAIDSSNDKIVTDEYATTVDPSGNSHSSLVVERYLGAPTLINGVTYPAGSLDPTFGTGGRTVTTMSGKVAGRSMALQLDPATGLPDGSVVVGGSYTPSSGAPSELALFRYTAAGVLDPTFGTGGVVIYNDPTLASDTGSSVAIQPNGEILLAGASGTTSPRESILARFQTNGAIDTSFANNGVARNYFTNAGGYFNDVTLQPDGKIVAVGTASTTSGKTTTTNFLIARFQGDTTPPAAPARPRAIASTTAPASNDTSPQLLLAPLTDQDLTALAIGLIGAGKKRRGLPAY
jgi:uncharacterized delta-60 repeat protein